MKASKDSLGDRMKGYEVVASRQFIKRMPVVLRLDGRAFHTYLKPIKRIDPFHPQVAGLMVATMLHLCKNIQNVKVGYTQSDEISLLLTDWEEYTTQQWFGGNQTKIETIAASMATGFFNWYKEMNVLLPEVKQDFAMFDCRAFNIPKEDVSNYFLWRQLDCERNSVSAYAQHYFPHKELQGKDSFKMREMLTKQANHPWHELPASNRYGTLYFAGRELDKVDSFTCNYELRLQENRNVIERYLK